VRKEGKRNTSTKRRRKGGKEQSGPEDVSKRGRRKKENAHRGAKEKKKGKVPAQEKGKEGKERSGAGNTLLTPSSGMKGNWLDLKKKRGNSSLSYPLIGGKEETGELTPVKGEKKAVMQNCNHEGGRGKFGGGGLSAKGEEKGGRGATFFRYHSRGRKGKKE